MAKFTIQKELLQPHFLGLNIDSVGIAVGKLKYCSMKLYLYLMCNSDGFTWNMNPAAFASWMGVDYSNASEARKVRRIIADGVEDLKECGFLIEVENGKYVISEQIVPKELSSNLGTNCSTLESSKEKIVPKLLEEKVDVQDEIVPKIQGSSLGTNCSDEDAQKEKIVPNCHGF